MLQIPVRPIAHMCIASTIVPMSRTAWVPLGSSADRQPCFWIVQHSRYTTRAVTLILRS